mmetsp:Transcript_41404/g.107258  ORF Transcript_41404/g.107258 Transcript_41404/m.107258 type:complete len:354 (-) Transcript_41404:120-1181(-)
MQFFRKCSRTSAAFRTFLRPFCCSAVRTMTTIATHSGTFHSDEALACYLLKELTPKYAGANIVRTRDQAVIEKADIVVDVGGVYDPETNRFDHHQRSFTDTFSGEYDIKLSSAGLIYKHFGKDAISELLKKEGISALSASDVEVVYQRVYKTFVKSMDAIDNGVPQYPDESSVKYVDKTGFADRVARLNPRWNDDTTSADAMFMEAVAMSGTEFKSIVLDATLSWLPARTIVQTAMIDRQSIDASGRIVSLPVSCPWTDHLFDLEVEMNAVGEVLYVLYPDKAGKWYVRAVSVAPSSFVCRKALPEPWRGVRDEKLSDLCGVPGCIFAHATGFVGGNVTYHGVLEMAKLSLKA